MARGYDTNKERLDILNSFGKTLAKRCKSCCELCNTNTSLSIFEVPPVNTPDPDKCVMLCENCLKQVEKPEQIEVNHWHCLNESVWSETAAVQVMAWRLLQHLKDHSWAQDLLDMLYLDDSVLVWAQEGSAASNQVLTVDSNGTRLEEGDSVHLIKDLDVKGTSFTAKRGTLVKNIHLTDDPQHVEGNVNKTHIVLKTQFLKKAN